MTDYLMQGPQFAKQYVSDYLKADIPGRMLRYRNGWDLDDETLPDPLLYLSHEPIALDHWPTLITVAISTNRFDQSGLTYAGDVVYRVTYSMRTYVWTRSDSSEEVTLMRDRLTAVVRSALLDVPSLQTLNDANGDYEAYIDSSSITEEFSDLTMLKGDRVLAGAYIGYDLVINEIVYRQQIAMVDTYEIEMQDMDPSEG
jgi:hypothetical protein